MLNGFAAAGLMFTSSQVPYHVLAGPMPVGLIGGSGFIFVAVYLLYRLYQQEKEGPIKICEPLIKKKRKQKVERKEEDKNEGFIFKCV